MADSNIPAPVARVIRRLGENVSLARRRRRMTQEDLAQRIGASVNTVRRLEAGHPGSALVHLARAMQVFGELDRLDQLLDTQQDAVGLALQDESLPQRVYARKRGKSASSSF
ncbi:helix-turn-helix transcriptional regulator [Variovorax sp. J31P179]|uniref:helix-turn-helix domain-containing protein n=1 Tax=Variovorax sp. J31P179 TaxID=3053508 RepID=UPI002575FB1D|nr:helix-turn-helix transcriptional regulator [Variovorax sp. J31P179]MDM0082288.1 helix-turn-helix transcriptional regulator [Variovorax sp. J31P179]